MNEIKRLVPVIITGLALLGAYQRFTRALQAANR